MKLKYIALMLATVLACGTFASACSKPEESQQQILTSREVDFSDIGLKYTTPEMCIRDRSVSGVLFSLYGLSFRTGHLCIIRCV